MASVRKRSWKAATGEAKAAWVVDYADSRGVRQRKHFPNKKAADAFRINIESQIQMGTYRPHADKVTVKDVCEIFLEHCEGRHRRDERMTRKMLAVYKGHVNNHILHAKYGVVGRKLSQLTAVGRRVSRPTSQRRRERADDPKNTGDPPRRSRLCVIGTRSEGSKKIAPPSKGDMRALLDAADEDLQLILLFAAATGVRAGEQWAVRWRDLDLDVRQLNISRRVDVYGEEGAPKSVAGVRTVPISASLATMLKAWKLKTQFKNPDDLIFPNGEGNHIGHDNVVKRRFTPLFEQLETAYKCEPTFSRKPPRRFNWHGLRHFAVSTWIEAGMTPKTVQTFAGHASLQMTMDRYGHLFPSEDHNKAMDQIAKGLFA